MNVIMLHGYGFDHSIWDDLELSSTDRIFRPNLPGFGSSIPEHYDYSMEQAANWLDQYIHKHVDRSYILIGHSMGGYIALSFLSRFTNNCVGLGLIHSHCFADSANKQLDRIKKAKFIKQHGTQLFLDPFYKSTFSNNCVPQRFIPYRDKYYKSLSVETLSNYMIGMSNRSDYSSFICNLDIPILMYHGIQDRLIDEKMMYEMATMAKIGIVEIDFQSAHMSMFENMTCLTKSINDLLNTCSIFDNVK